MSVAGEVRGIATAAVPRAVAAGACALALAGAARGQSEVWHLVGGAPGEALGSSVALLGDVDGDGRADVAASSVVANGSKGVVRVWSGATGAELWHVDGTVAGVQFGCALAGLDDVDGDGASDLAVGAYAVAFPGASGAGAVRIYSGATGALVREHRGDATNDHLGWSVADAGDVDGDGVGDVIAGAVDDDDGGASSGTARVWSGATGATLLTVVGTAAQQVYGYSVAGAGDVDGDGRADFVVGGPYFASSTLTGIARLHSGATGAVLYTWTGTEPKDSLGSSVAGVGDADGDGVPDVLVGARQMQVGRFGYARLYSGATGAQLLQLDGDSSFRNFGTAVARAGDVDYDGRADFVVSTPTITVAPLNTGIARLYSGASGATLHDWVGAAANAKLGAALAGGLDVTAEGSPDLVLGAPGDASGGLNAGGVYVVKANDEPPPPPAEPPAFSADVVEVSLSAGTVQHLALDAGDEHAGMRYVILGSMSGTSPGFVLDGITVPLNPDAYMRYALGHAGHRAPLQGSRGELDAEGKASASFEPKRGWRASCLVGRTFHHAYVVLEPPYRRCGPRARAIRRDKVPIAFASNEVEVTIVP